MVYDAIYYSTINITYDIIIIIKKIITLRPKYPTCSIAARHSLQSRKHYHDGSGEGNNSVISKYAHINDTHKNYTLHAIVVVRKCPTCAIEEPGTNENGGNALNTQEIVTI